MDGKMRKMRKMSKGKPFEIGQLVYTIMDHQVARVKIRNIIIYEHEILSEVVWNRTEYGDWVATKNHQEIFTTIDELLIGLKAKFNKEYGDE